MASEDSRTSLEIPACFRCHVPWSTRYGICGTRHCRRRGDRNKVAFCKTCFPDARCGECGCTFQHEQAVLPSLSYTSSQPATYCEPWSELDWLPEEQAAVIHCSGAFCWQCNSEDPLHGRSGYCDYCWQCWNGRIPEKAVSEGGNFPQPEVSHYPNFNRLVENQLLTQGVPCFEVDVCDEDFLAVALRLRQKFPNDPEPLILSPCSRMSSGGAAGPAGQSMLGALCQSTTWQAVAERAFPIGSNHAVYVPGVRVYHVVGKPASNFSVSVLATPPSQFRDVSDSYYHDLLARMCGLIEICKLRGHRLLVIGAWGCGSRKHPPEAVAWAFKQALESQKDAFSHVIFAIKGDKKTLTAFQKAFGVCT
ncbi:unnamed protein product [Symbiodinium sp. CCMP2456]|nr:unnamed protein product [Symbiodinium sp. CCMP2456]